jgi:hypothetical protein
MKYSGGFFIIMVSNFAKRIMPKIFIELNLERKYSNPHLILEKIGSNNLCSGSTGQRTTI